MTPKEVFTTPPTAEELRAAAQHFKNIARAHAHYRGTFRLLARYDALAADALLACAEACENTEGEQ